MYMHIHGNTKLVVEEKKGNSDPIDHTGTAQTSKHKMNRTSVVSLTMGSV